MAVFIMTMEYITIDNDIKFNIIIIIPTYLHKYTIIIISYKYSCCIFDSSYIYKYTHLVASPHTK